MEVYGTQLGPLLRTLILRGGPAGLRSDGDANERALCRASPFGLPAARRPAA